MKFTKKKLERLIKEETETMLSEAGMDPSTFRPLVIRKLNEIITLLKGSSIQEGVYDPENQESRPKLSREEMVSKTVEELEEEYRSFGCTDLGATASADAKSYCNMLKGGISTKQKVSLQEIIKQEVKAVLSEQLATFRHGLQQRSDLMRNQSDEEFKMNIERQTKQQLLKLVSKLESRPDATAKRQLALIKAGFPYNLKDGAVSSLADLKTSNTATKNTQPTED